MFNWIYLATEEASSTSYLELYDNVIFIKLYLYSKAPKSRELNGILVNISKSIYIMNDQGYFLEIGFKMIKILGIKEMVKEKSEKMTGNPPGVTG